MITNTLSTNINAGSPMCNLNNRRNGVIALPGTGEKMVTKGQSNLSDEEFKNKIEEMTKRDHATGKNSRGSAEWHQLLNDYVSSASPDRTGIIKNTLSGLSNRLNMILRPKMSLLDMIMKNSRMFGTKDIGNNFINFRDGSGNLIAMYNSTGWTNVFTPAEEARHREFTIMWDDARVRAAQEVGHADIAINNTVAGFTIDLGYFLSRNAPFDMAKLAAHGITYDAETGETHVDKEKLQQATGRQVADKPTVGWNG